MKGSKKLGFFVLVLSTVFFLGIFSSCSNKGCLYSHKRYQKKSAFAKSRSQNKPGKVKHFYPIRKKYIVNNKKRNILGNK